ncbi:MAG: hypothetical protein ACRD28_01600 [Acidobacteriaceae bacterium]
MRQFKWSRIRLACGATIVLAVFFALSPVAHAASYVISIHVDGLSAGGNYSPASFSWGPSSASTGQGVSDEITFTATPDSSVAELMTDAQSRQVLGTAELQESLLGGVAVDIQMDGVRIESVRIAGGPNGPETIVTLKFDSVLFTFQQLLPNGQKSGLPLTFSASFKR